MRVTKFLMLPVLSITLLAACGAHDVAPRHLTALALPDVTLPIPTTTAPPTTIPAVAISAPEHRSRPRASRAEIQRPNYANTSVSAALACIRQHESGGNYGARGQFRGAYQYLISTWAKYAGFYDPADAPPTIQDQRAAADFARGPRQIHQNWPVTSRMCGL